MTARIYSAGLIGMDGYTVEVEADLATGLPRFDIVGLPDLAVKESRDRVCAAVKNCGYEFPVGKITVNLAPADLKKSGPVYDLAIFLSLLAASGQLFANLEKCLFVGELSLNGDIRPVNGVLAMEILRQPMEDGTVTISRASGTLSYPCSIMLIAAMNPCPCGYFGHPTRPCTCSRPRVTQYLAKVSGPLLDRLDLHIDVMPVDFESISSRSDAETSAVIKARADRARALQRERYRGTGISCNARLTPAQLQKTCPVTDSGMALLRSAFDKLGLSARAYERILKVSRTIADLDGCEQIGSSHIAEAVQYRSLDRKYWLAGKD